MSGGKINFNHHQYFQYVFLNLPVKSCSLQNFGQLEGLKKSFFGDFLQALEDPGIDKPKELVFNFEQAFLGHKAGMCGDAGGGAGRAGQAGCRAGAQLEPRVRAGAAGTRAGAAASPVQWFTRGTRLRGASWELGELLG